MACGEQRRFDRLRELISGMRRKFCALGGAFHLLGRAIRRQSDSIRVRKHFRPGLETRTTKRSVQIGWRCRCRCSGRRFRWLGFREILVGDERVLAPADWFVPFLVVFVALAAVLLQNEQGFDGGVVGALRLDSVRWRTSRRRGAVGAVRGSCKKQKGAAGGVIARSTLGKSN